MRKIIFLVIGLTMAMGVEARSMREIWTSLPDSLLPYVDRNHRLEMVEFIDMNLNGDVDNLFGGKSEMDTITTDYIGLTLSQSSSMQIKRLPVAGGDSLLCVVKTYLGPAAESEVVFYHQDWTPASVMLSLDSAGAARWMPRLLVKPDTMSEEHFVHYKTFISPYIVGARLSPDDDNLELRLSLPMPVREEKQALEAMTPSFSLRWDAVKQNFCAE